MSRAPRQVPALRDVHRGRRRPGLRVPLVWARVRRRPRSRPACLGKRGRVDGRGGAPAARVARGCDRAEESLGEQNLALALALPERPLVLGGCCCSHVGVIEGLSARFDRLALVWIDAHGDLNTHETSPSGNQWGMPLRMVLDSGAVRIEDTVLIGRS